MHNQLINAAYNGNLDRVQELLTQGVNVNTIDGSEFTALMATTSRDYTEIARLLIENGANVNLQNNSGYTALMWAAIHGYPGVLSLLLERGADPLLQNKDGLTAFNIAKANDSALAISILENFKLAATIDSSITANHLAF